MTAPIATSPPSAPTAREIRDDAAGTGRSSRSAPDRPVVERLTAAAYRIPTDQPESDGTYAWDATTLVVVELEAGGVHGLGYSYADEAAVAVAVNDLAPVVVGRDALDIPGAWAAMVGAVRNVGRGGIAATAISAVDVALWDLKARLLDAALIDLLGAARPAIPAYGSGGFCSYDDRTLADQLGGWAEAGFRFVKM